MRLRAFRKTGPVVVETMDLPMMLFKAAIFAVTYPLAVLPLGLARGFGAFGGRVVFFLWRGRREFAVDNLQKAVEMGGLQLDMSAREAARRSFEHMGRSFMELARVYHNRIATLIERMPIQGEEHYRRAKAKGRGVIWITGHCGNWEMMALALSLKLNIRFHVVARAQNNRFVHQLVEDLRSKSGNEIIYKKGAVKGFLSTLRKNGDVGILIDQAVLVKEGELVNFLGRPAVTTKLPVIIARKTKTPLLGAFVHRKTDGSHVMEITPEIEPSTNPDAEAAVLEDMQKVTNLVEDYIRRHPDQWLWGHRRWKRAPEEFPEGRDPKRMLEQAGR